MMVMMTVVGVVAVMVVVVKITTMTPKVVVGDFLQFSYCELSWHRQTT